MVIYIIIYTSSDIKYEKERPNNFFSADENGDTPVLILQCWNLNNFFIPFNCFKPICWLKIALAAPSAPPPPAPFGKTTLSCSEGNTNAKVWGLLYASHVWLCGTCMCWWIRCNSERNVLVSSSPAEITICSRQVHRQKLVKSDWNRKEPQGKRSSMMQEHCRKNNVWNCIWQFIHTQMQKPLELPQELELLGIF